MDDDLGFGGRGEIDGGAQSGNARANDMDGWAVHRAFPDESDGGAARAREIAAAAPARNAAFVLSDKDGPDASFLLEPLTKQAFLRVAIFAAGRERPLKRVLRISV